MCVECARHAAIALKHTCRCVKFSHTFGKTDKSRTSTHVYKLYYTCVIRNTITSLLSATCNFRVGFSEEQSFSHGTCRSFQRAYAETQTERGRAAIGHVWACKRWKKYTSHIMRWSWNHPTKLGAPWQHAFHVLRVLRNKCWHGHDVNTHVMIFWTVTKACSRE